MGYDLDPVIDIARLIGAGVVGGLVAQFASHRLSISRDKASGRSSRKRELKSFLRSWHTEVSRTYFVPGGISHKPEVFADNVSAFRALAEGIRDDFSKRSRSRFDVLMSDILTCDPHDPNRTKEVIGSAIAFLEADN